MLLFELAKLAALWDKPDKNRESIPTLLELIDDPDVWELVASEHRQAEKRDTLPTFDDDGLTREFVEARKRRFEAEKSRRVREAGPSATRLLRRAFEAAQPVVRGTALGDLRVFRNHIIAHNLELPKVRPGEPDPIKFRLGDERRLLESAIEVVDALYRALRRADFDWRGSWDMARRNAEDLWHRCRFDF